MYRIIIEDEGSYHFCRNGRFSNEKVIWHVTSPWLLEKLPKLGEDVFSLEEHITFNDQKELGNKCILVSEIIGEKINKLLTNESKGLHFGDALIWSISWYIFVLLYKSNLLNFWYEKYNDSSQLIVIGDPKSSKISTFAIMNNIRFSNLYAEIAHNSINKEINIVEYKNDNMEYDSTAYFSKDSRLKILRILNRGIFNYFIDVMNNYNEIANLNFNNNKIKNNNKQYSYVIMKGCPLLSETVRYLKKLNGVKIVNNCLGKGNIEQLLESLKLSKMDLPFDDIIIGKVIRDSVRTNNITTDDFIDSSLNILAFQVCRSLEYGLDIVNHFESIFSSISLEVHSGFNVITNSVLSPYGRLFQEYLENMGITFFVFEHGVSAGICEVSSKYYYSKFYVTKKSKLIAYNESSGIIISKSSTDGKYFVAGSPEMNKRLRHPYFQKSICRNLFNNPKSTRNIMYLNLLTRNNFMIPPFTMTDYDYYNHTKRLITHVFSVLDDNFLLKLYPANRYKDSDPFSKLIQFSGNVSLIEGVDFKFIRSCCDAIILSLTGSTFGWAWSANVPTIFLELESFPIMPNVKDLFDRALFRFDTSKKYWDKQLIDLLSIPDDEFNHLWKSKSDARDELSNYIFGPKGNSGKRAADYIYKSVIENGLLLK